MINNIQEERLRWITPIINKELRYTEVLKTCPHSKRSLERWVKMYKGNGVSGLQPKSTRPKAQPNETPIRIKEEVISLRKETKLCALKLHWRLKKTKGLLVPVSTISKIIKSEGLTRKYRMKKIKYKHLRTPLSIGEMVEIDVKAVPGPIQGHRYKQYTAIDMASRWRYLRIYDEESTHHSICFLKEVIKRFPHKIQSIKTDNHSTFTNYYVGGNKRSDLSVKTVHELDIFCASQSIVHYLIDKGKPNQNGKVERSHREDQEKLYDKYEFRDVSELISKIKEWNRYYNDLEHCGLDGKTPNEMLGLESAIRVWV